MPSRWSLHLPPLTRGLFVVLLCLSALNVSLRFRRWTSSLDSPGSSLTSPSNYVSAPELAIPYLVIVPTTSLKFPWTFVTAALVENNGVALTISALVIWFGGRYLERAWGSTEFGKFLLFTTWIPNLFAFLVYAIWHGVVGAPEQYVNHNNIIYTKS